MTRDRFLHLLKEFDDNYTAHKGSVRKHLEDKCKKENITIKESNKGSRATCFYSQIDYLKIKNITERGGKDNPFLPLYNCHEIELKNLFKLFQDVHILLENDFLGARSYKDRMSLISKYNAVIDDLSKTNERVEFLLKRKKALEKEPILTKRKIFEHLLFRIWILLVFDKKKHTDSKHFKCTEKVANITNKIIKEYFNEDITFSRKMNFSYFTKHTYLQFSHLEKEVREKYGLDIQIDMFHTPKTQG